ncbi:MAG: hypothetical protein K1X74_13715 [Pirellulales bacterium]|nr:hypothetical protein [Pirellulales bacterium]
MVQFDQLGPDVAGALDEMIGYVNFSSGAPDQKFQRRLADVFAAIEAACATGKSKKSATRCAEAPWGHLGRLWARRIDEVEGSTPAFAELAQARSVVAAVFSSLLPAYRQHHRDLLAHQPDEALFRPLFLARACEAYLKAGPPWEEQDRLQRTALEQLNVFLGYRPLAVLERKKLEPYDHERVAPVPLYFRGVGVAVGRYAEIVTLALATLQDTPSELLTNAGLDVNLLDELSLDPRAYDFDHPANKRLNYHFGQWDPDLVDNAGNYRRFVLTQVTLDSLLERVDELQGAMPREELVAEAAAVLAGVMLMAAAITGSGPAAHDSSVTLASLVPKVAQLRDRFYERLIEQLPPDHRRRLKAEAVSLRQPFAGARQHLNRALARRRAIQLQHVHLAGLFARLGYPDSARRQVAVVQVASARMRCEIDCMLTAGHYELARGEVGEARNRLTAAIDLLHRAIHCGALVDPWNMLGFAGNFSLFPAVENTVHDHRVDELIELVERIFGLCTRAMREAAAAGNTALVGELADQTESLASWWDQFASVEVESLDSFSGLELWESGVHVAAALRAWHEAGAAAGDVAFWRNHVDKFDSPKAFALVVETLLDKHDHVSALALLVQWLSVADELPLADAEHSFHNLAIRWVQEIQPLDATSPEAVRQSWQQSCRLLDFFEANAEEYWDVPVFELGPEISSEELWEWMHNEWGEEGEAEEDEDGIYSAAYDDVTYRDSTDDDNESELLEAGSLETEFELDLEAGRIRDRLGFLVTLARIWRIASANLLRNTKGQIDDAQREVLTIWCRRAEENRRRLAELLRVVHRHPLEPLSGNQQAMVEFDRRRQVKLALLERIVAAGVEYGDAVRVISASLGAAGAEPSGETERGKGLARWERPVVGLLRALSLADRAVAQARFAEVLAVLEQQPVLYVPLSRGGGPQRVQAAQHVLKVVRQLLVALPRSGLHAEAFQLLASVQRIEREFVPGAGAVTEFDRLYQLGFTGMVEGLLRSAGDNASDAEIVDGLHHLTELALQRWLEHSRSLRLSVLERVSDEESWNQLKSFIERYGHDLFTQRFLNFGHVRAILHQGVGAWLEALVADPEREHRFRLLDELDSRISRDTAISHLEVVLEAVVENYVEYRDYNSTTTQSDRGELLFVLLDFLRLKANYQRIAWNLRPVFQAHEVLVRHGRTEAAELWQQAVAERTADIAGWHRRRLGQLVDKYGVRLPTVADRIAENFTRPLAVDRVRALLSLVRIDPQTGKSTGGTGLVEQLEQELVEFTEQPTGVGLDVPDWLSALEEEEQELSAPRGVAQLSIVEILVPQANLSLAETLDQLRTLSDDQPT